jgi:hypothetical protein
MTVLDVHQATDDQPCRSCGELIQRGRRLAVVAGVGAVHIACVGACQAGAATTADQGSADLVGGATSRPGPEPAAADDRGKDATGPPDVTTPRPPRAPPVDDDRGDPRQTPWWQW